MGEPKTRLTPRFPPLQEEQLGRLLNKSFNPEIAFLGAVAERTLP